MLGLATLFALFLALPCLGKACTCAPPVPGQEDVRTRAYLNSADIVFRGEIVAHKDGAAVFQVREQWKGNLGTKVEVEWRRGDRGDCNGFWPNDLKVGNELLVFATRGRDGVYRTSICQPTGLASKAQGLIRDLGPGKPTRKGD